MSYYVENLEYSLAKRVHAMERGFAISTDYGDIDIASEEGQYIISAVRNLLEKKLARAKKSEEVLRKALERKAAKEAVGGAA